MSTQFIERVAVEVDGEGDAVLMIHGLGDRPTPVRLMGEKIARSRVEVLRGCGHWTPVEMPEECAALLAQFYAQRM